MDIKSLLKELNITCQWFDITPCITCAESAALLPEDRIGIGTKNLLFRDKKGRNYFLLVTDEYKTVDSKALAEQIESTRLSMANEEKLQQLLGVGKGSVSLFALVNDPEQQVQLLLDEDLLKATHWDAHPNRNDAVLILSREDWLSYFKYLNRSWITVKV
ncbi:Prolyl-tRNA deacylase proX [Phocoenobacter uteri]|uniref:Prolyl-tRNA deacylase proX n=1 Tax=Phocoenobacter uteri TaxID=146806 RepID=A0A379C9X4_9PAST|nr:YbaK/EbsC family protein [Phocoenobacter uteri]MDG6881098.1 hypothetical protein [Phocoenobacter uteri]SUB59120.1 Prolyl-tRNA deacylase proX [Phocoenobacter uteri]